MPYGSLKTLKMSKCRNVRTDPAQSADPAQSVYGVVKKSGVGLCFNKLGWGEFAILPEKYNDLLW